MKLKRAILAAILFAGLVRAGIAVLEPVGTRGLAGAVVQNNLRHGTDATGLFYTEIDRRAFQPTRD